MLVVWTSGDKEVALKMVFMYTYNSKIKNWWDNVCLLVWGASAKLLSEDVELQKNIGKMKEAGIKLLACKACSDSYNVTEDLEKMGIEVKYVGEDFTNYLKDKEWTTVTF